MTTPQPGDFGLVSIKGDVGLLIRLGQLLNGDGFNDYEHAFLYLGDGRILEAEPGGARVADVSEYDGRNILWSTDLIPLTGDQRAAILAKASTYVGAPYSFLDYLAIALYRLHIKAPFIVNRVKSADHIICSVVVSMSYDVIGYNLQSGNKSYPPYLITPGKLTKYLLGLMKNDKARS